MTSGKITDAQATATCIKNYLKDIAKTEGHDYVPPEEQIADFIGSLEPEESHFANRHLDRPDEKGHIPSADIADIFRNGRK